MRAAAKMLRGAKRMTVASAAGTKLDIDMAGASTVGVWGWTDRPGTLAHWPGGIVVSFPQGGAVNGTLVLDRGDINLTFKRYLEAPVRLTLEADYVTRIEGEGADAEMMRGYLAAWGDREAYAVSHVGFGMNRKARYEALAMYDRRDTNGTELRAVAGNFLFSTGANEFAGRYTAGHFDIPVMRTTIAVDGTVVVRDGVLQDVFGYQRGLPSPSGERVERRNRECIGWTRQAQVVEDGDETRLSRSRAVGLEVEVVVVEEALAASSGRYGPRPCCVRRSRVPCSAVAERLGQVAAGVIENVAAAPVDELEHAEGGKAKAEAVLDGLVDVLGGGDAFLDHARGLVHGERLDARHDVAGTRRAHDGHLADTLQQRFEARGDGRIGAGAGRQLDERHQKGRVEPVRIQKALRVRRPRSARSSTRMVEVVEAMIGLGPGERRNSRQNLALEVRHLGHAFEDHGGIGERAGGLGLAARRTTRAAMRIDGGWRRRDRSRRSDARVPRTSSSASRCEPGVSPPASRALKSTIVTGWPA